MSVQYFMSKISIKTNILTVFLLLVGVVSLCLVFSQYYFSKELAIKETSNTFNIVAKNITRHLKEERSKIDKVLAVKSQYSDILEPISFDYKHPALESLMQMLQLNSNMQSTYFTDSNGAFFQLINIQDRPQLLKYFKAPPACHWVVSIVIENKMQNIFLDRDLKVIKKTQLAKNYDPRKRIWYTNAMHSSSVIMTQPYLFTDSEVMGISYAKKVSNSGVVLALDYTLKQLDKILSLQKFDDNSEIFLVNSEGKKIISSNAVEDLNDLHVNIDKVLVQAVRSNRVDKVINYNIGEKNYFTILKKLDDNRGFLVIKINSRELFKPYRESIEHSLLIALGLLLVALPIILLSTNLIVKPIKALILENEKIKRRAFNEVNHIKTYILEFDELSDSLVSMALSIKQHEKRQEELLDAIIKLIAEAIDAKSHYTGGHCERVPEVAQLLLDAVNKSNEGNFREFSVTSKEALREFEIGAWLHDCGKVTTPEYVVDKATKLETIYNRIHEIRMRFEVLWRDAEIEYLQQKISQEDLHVKQESLQSDFAFVASANVGGEFMGQEQQQRIKTIAQQQWQRYFSDRLGLGEIEKLRYPPNASESLPVSEDLLSDKTHHLVKRENFDLEAYERDGFKDEVPEYLYNYGEIYNLCIAKGTLSPEERFKINEHVIMTIKMLEKIPFPKEMKNIPEYAGTHHETLIGTGYPRKLHDNELSIPAKIMAIADIFEALTASDRPYKKAKTLSESLKIMSFMVKDRHIDAELFRLFLTSGTYELYAHKYLNAEQIDKVDIDAYLS